ncbi:hypothetical protein [Thermococcus sp.]|uniref:hypothetical protein n=1 Tax=Thermococcus sp. TaxID=35749 RepID=UPI0026073005|nr:hypothetical protein [Thermococcus sp.]
MEIPHPNTHNPATSTTENNELIEFLKYAHTLLENRINMLDQKANILIGTQTLFFSVFAYFVKNIIEKELQNKAHNFSLIRIVSIGEAIIFTITLMLLLLTLRPTWGLKMRNIKLSKLSNGSNYVIWFSRTFPQSFQDYKQKVDNLTKDDILENYERAHFTALQLIRAKYKYYRWAVVFSKALILTGSSIIIYVLWTL